MSKLSNFLQRPSPIIVERQKQQQKNKKMVCFDEELTRQLSNISNEAYHRDKSASVPFVWESQPGTPKVRSQENSLPPLTPPPSYYQNATKNPINIKAKIKNSPKATFLQTIFLTKRTTRKSCVNPPPPAGPSSFDQSYSSSSSSSSSPRLTSYSSVPSSPMIHSRKGEEEEELYEVTSSNMCFGNARARGCYSSMFKKVLLGYFL